MVRVILLATNKQFYEIRQTDLGHWQIAPFRSATAMQIMTRVISMPGEIRPGVKIIYQGLPGRTSEIIVKKISHILTV